MNTLSTFLTEDKNTHLEHLEDDILNNDYYALLKIAFPLLYIPMCKRMGIYEENFIN